MERSNSDSGLTAQRSVLKTRLQNNKEQIFCEWRRRWVRLTPEEWVRQQLLHRLVEQFGYPASLIAVEVGLEKLKTLSGSSFHAEGEECVTAKRCDAVIYNRSMQPLMIIECKAETVPLTQKVLDQAVTYNRRLHVPWLLLHNGPQTVCVHMTDTSSTCSSIPSYDIL